MDYLDRVMRGYVVSDDQAVRRAEQKNTPSTTRCGMFGLVAAKVENKPKTKLYKVSMDGEYLSHQELTMDEYDTMWNQGFDLEEC